MTPSADESAIILTNHLKNQEPFSYWRFGDGFLELMQCREGRTCDGEAYTPELGRDMSNLPYILQHQGDPSTVYFGDWQAASFERPDDPARYADQWQRTFSEVEMRQWGHPEALLFMRESAALADFYRAVKSDPRRKLYMGPAANDSAAAWLGAFAVLVPMRNLHADVDRITDTLMREDFDVLLFGAGLAGMIPAVRCWERFPKRTFIHLGSALDPMFRGKSRKQQLTKEQCWRMFGEKP